MELRLHPRAQAHGKTIVLGEHSVVHGYPALAAGLPGGVTLTASPRPDPRQPSTLRIPAWGIDLELRVESEHPVARAALEVLGHCDGPLTGWAIAAQSTLLPGAGLGSSAALTVALARLALGPHADVGAVVEASLAGERIFHGEPSGLDSQVAARGGLLRFVRGQEPTPIPLSEPLPLLIVPSGVERRTAVQVAQVRARVERLPALGRPLLEVLGRSVDEGIETLRASKGPHDRARLGEIMQVAHGVLAALGVSCAALDALCSTALRHGALGAKLTGAGGGGCVLVLPGDDPRPIIDAFTQQGHAPISFVLHGSSPSTASPTLP
ncbi:mevalonate kinase [Paraliomyxa miuraensis]|uniref:mevalonate kinase n=1 Tax=Paraliomyxa miuraensis TaxID=376150 RepID=UPI00224E5964|nr:mevalonate kinase [Paraliomyxa miuraensis]MCX4244462.1 mevalonate kinase [Paraliomyxa miuraensis]